MNTHNDAFYNELIGERLSARILMYNTQRISGKTTCFVEGRMDELVYKNSSIDILSREVQYNAGNNKKTITNKEEEGKEAVIGTYLSIRKNETLKKDLKSCVFIVDYDFEGVTSSKHQLTKNEKTGISVTPYHSVESFFVEKNNLNAIFEKLGLKQDDAETAYCELEKLTGKTSDFFALRGAITSQINVNKVEGRINIRYKAKHSNEEIFNIENISFFNEEYLSEEIQAMKKEVFRIPDAKKKYDEIKKRVGGGPPYIRGHTAYDFLYSYLKEMHDIDLNKAVRNNRDLIKCLQIDMVIKAGNGKELHHPG